MTDKRFNPEKAHKLMSADRRKKLPPDEVIKYMDLEQNHNVADLGAGTGYFTIPISKQTKEVYAVDIEPKMLEMLKENAAEEGLKNIHYVESDLDHIQLEDNSADWIMCSFVIHEVPDVNQTLQEIKRILKPDGQLFMIEWEAVETDSGPPLNHRIPSENLMKSLELNGFHAELIQLNPENYACKAVPK
ncbi:class I SAM-dependent methyltransferase [Virgibacillus siamensis]|uniref:class I SAM-dependent methyltransferase n=1 Tax=Virgibacillus siamensis TaxID=480071 RepID=UPI0009861CAD|nr:methyltransferase domain-containing protein [Virgibacillus siamensis]